MVKEGMDVEGKNEKREWLRTRDVLWCLCLVGFGVNQMTRLNLNIAIVSMVQSRPKTNITISNECIEIAPNSTFLENEFATKLPAIEQGFDWNEKEQGMIMGALYWLYWATHLPGGMLAQKYGAKMVFGLSNFVGLLLGFAIPAAAHMGFKYLIMIRVLQGLVMGVAWPSMHYLTARWIPPNERSKFLTAYLGNSIGAALTFPMCGYIMANWGWEPVFYVCGIIGIIWYVAWYFMVSDSPAEHPRISEAEKNYIVRSLGKTVSKEKLPTPWKSLLTSVPVWIHVLAHSGGIWGLLTAITHAPTYFKVIHGWNIQATGWLSGLPHIARLGFALVFAPFADYLLTSNMMSRTNVRKLATIFACILQGLCFVLLAYSGCNYTAAIVLLMIAIGFHGAVASGTFAGFIDISPNFANIAFGLSGTISLLPGFISPAIVGYLTFNNQTLSQWQKVFWIAAGVLIVSGVIYVIFAKSELQSWNNPQRNNDAILESELKTLESSDTKDEQEQKECDSNQLKLKTPIMNPGN